jgi:predicted PurR-regulated permease PerM
MDYGYSDYIAYRLKWRAIGFITVVFGLILYFASRAIYTNVHRILMQWWNNETLALMLSVSTTVWIIIGFFWGCYILYKDGK